MGCCLRSVAAWLLIAWGAAGLAQDAGVTTLSVQAKVVSVPVLVRDKKGVIVSGLRKEDFSVTEDGKAQTVQYFSADSTLPLTVALLVDTSGSQRDFIEEEVRASGVFVRTMLTRDEDRAALIQFDTSIWKIRGMTSSVAELTAGLPLLGEDHEPGRQAAGGGGTLLYDAVSTICSGMLGKQAGRRAMILLTDGEDQGSHHTLDHAISEALLADTMIYSILYSHEKSSFEPGRGREVLEALSRATGGRVFTVTRKMGLEAIYGEIAEDLRLQYLVGYRPADAGAGTFHRIAVKAAGKGLVVRAREGYFTGK